MGFFNFGRRKPGNVRIPNSGDMGVFHMTWQRKRLPSPGAQNYAWTTLGLVPTSIISGAVAVRRQINPLLTAPQPHFQKAVTLNGLPTVSGQILSAPLFNPDTGGFNTSPNVYVGAAYDRPEILPAGQVT